MTNKMVEVEYNSDLVSLFEEILMSITDEEFEYTKLLVAQIEARRKFIKNLLK